MRENRPRSRRLSADEHHLWRTVVRQVKPLRPAPADAPAPEEAESPAAPPRPPPAQSAAPARAARVDPVPPPLAPLERRLRQRLAKGHAPIDKRLDLHGLTQREAHDALVHFLHAAQAHGARVVLVVTGKGRGAERDPGAGRDSAAGRDPFVERGVLRRLVPHWLNAPELRRIVIGFEAAHLGHGGEGALYVRLRRARG